MNEPNNGENPVYEEQAGAVMETPVPERIPVQEVGDRIQDIALGTEQLYHSPINLDEQRDISQIGEDRDLRRTGSSV